ncbi:hypothetical protein MTO96_021529 [Rhipicephalus appendiculatus]
MAISFASRGTKLNGRCCVSACGREGRVAGDATSCDVTAACIGMSKFLGGSRALRRRWEGRSLSAATVKTRHDPAGASVRFSAVPALLSSPSAQCSPVLCFLWDGSRLSPLAVVRRAGAESEPQTLAPPTDNENNSKLARVPFQQNRQAFLSGHNETDQTRRPLLLRRVNSALLKRRLYQLQARRDGFVTEYGLL